MGLGSVLLSHAWVLISGATPPCLKTAAVGQKSAMVHGSLRLRWKQLAMYQGHRGT